MGLVVLLQDLDVVCTLQLSEEIQRLSGGVGRRVVGVRGHGGRLRPSRENGVMEKFQASTASSITSILQVKQRLISTVRYVNQTIHADSIYLHNGSVNQYKKLIIL